MQTKMATKRPIERPVAGFVLSLLGGLFITAGGVYNLSYSPAYYYSGYPPYQTNGLIGLVTGAGVLVGSALLHLLPRQRVAWGVMVLVFGVSSLFSLYGPNFVFFFPGVILTLVGGSLAIAWNRPAGLGFEDYRTCLGCGRHVPAEYPLCPYCGTRLAIPGTAPPSPP